ncbi:hypothetical protein C6499_19105 [Candidatus Poribacteria bacterium]|nr:MAG: hypothetical protein C6499_19105 [Candidatus Poribacteria bacterium]
MLYEKDEVLETYEGYQIVYCHGWGNGTKYLVHNGRVVCHGDKGVPEIPKVCPVGTLLAFRNTQTVDDVKRYIDKLIQRIVDLERLKRCLKETEQDTRLVLDTEKYRLYDTGEPESLRWIVFRKKDEKIYRFQVCGDAQLFGEGEGFILCDYEKVK